MRQRLIVEIAGTAMAATAEDSIHQQVTIADRESGRYTWYVIFVLFFVNIFNTTDRMALSVLAPAIQSDLGLSDSQLGMLTGFAFALFYAVCAIPLAKWADRGVRRNIIGLSLLVWSVMTALSGAALNFVQLFLARVGVGAGEAGGAPPAQSLLCDYAPPKRRPLILAINNCGLAAGMMLGMALAGFLEARLGWRWTFVALGVPGIAFALLVLTTLREPLRGRFDSANRSDEANRRDEKSPISVVRTFKILASCKTYRYLVSYAALNVFAGATVMQWGPSFIKRVYSIDLSTIGIFFGIAIGVGTAVGLLLGGFIADKVIERDVKLPLKIGVGAAALSFPAAIGALFSQSFFATIILVFVMFTSLGFANVPFLATVCNVVSSRIRATAVAVSVFCQSVIGYGLGPYFAGVLSDRWAPALGVQSVRYAIVTCTCALPVACVMLYLAARTLPKDLESAEMRF